MTSARYGESYWHEVTVVENSTVVLNMTLKNVETGKYFYF